jgi:hypothetical protein
MSQVSTHYAPSIVNGCRYTACSMNIGALGAGRKPMSKEPKCPVWCGVKVPEARQLYEDVKACPAYKRGKCHYFMRIQPCAAIAYERKKGGGK